MVTQTILPGSSTRSGTNRRGAPRDRRARSRLAAHAGQLATGTRGRGAGRPASGPAPPRWRRRDRGGSSPSHREQVVLHGIRRATGGPRRRERFTGGGPGRFVPGLTGVPVDEDPRPRWPGGEEVVAGLELVAVPAILAEILDPGVVGEAEAFVVVDVEPEVAGAPATCPYCCPGPRWPCVGGR